jgi:response regulator RpfG family c-di-GMP phosphodiesterase
MLTILIVDDDQFELIRLEKFLSELSDCNFIFKNHNHEALQWCQSHNVDLVIVDYQMPELDGLQFIEAFRFIEKNGDIPLIMITSSDSEYVCINALQGGANDFIVKPLYQGELLVRVSAKLALRKKQLAAENMISEWHEEVDSTSKVVSEREIEIVKRFIIAAEYHDNETGQHIARMAYYCKLIAKNWSLSAKQQNMIFQASPLHVVGKLGIPDKILFKPGKLTTQEFSVIKKHAVIGGKILQNSSSLLIVIAQSIALTHHEKFDGSVYPYGLAADEIPLTGRITSIADVFDALTSKRPYKDPWSFYLQENNGTWFYPRCIRAFLSDLDSVKAIYKEELMKLDSRKMKNGEVKNWTNNSIYA